MVAAAEEHRVDIGIPAYGRPKFLTEAVESVLAQTFDAWRLTISDDGPPEARVEQAIRAYLDDPRITYVTTDGPIGMTQNWSRLVQGASADYVAILHDDDRWRPEFLARRIAFLEEHVDCAFVFSPTDEIDENGQVIGRSRSVLQPGVHPARSLIPTLLLDNLVGHPPSVVVRRAAYEAVGPSFNDELPYPDYEMWFRLALRFPAGFVASTDAEYRRHPGSSTAVERHETERYLRLFDHLVALADAADPSLIGSRARRRPRSDILLAIALDALEAGERRRSARAVARAIRTYPPSAVDARVPAWLAALPLGRVGGRALRRLRRLRAEKGVRLHVRPMR